SRCGWRWPRCTCGWRGASGGDDRKDSVELIRGAIRTYAWGSRTAIADFTGREVPAAHPEAELWLGAHPADPAWVETEHGERSLLDVLHEDPEGQLGPVVRAR